MRRLSGNKLTILGNIRARRAGAGTPDDVRAAVKNCWRRRRTVATHSLVRGGVPPGVTTANSRPSPGGAG